MSEEQRGVQGVSTGTTIMACAFKDGVVLAADSRTSTGSYVANRVSRKVTQISPCIFMCRSGSAADTQSIAHEVKGNLYERALVEGSKYPSVFSVAHATQATIRRRKGQPMAGLIIAGVDSTGGHVFSIPVGGSLLEVPIAIGGSGSGYVYGLVDEIYRHDMDESEVKAFVKSVVSHAMARDGSSGGLIRMTVVRKDGSVSEDTTFGESLPYLLKPHQRETDGGIIPTAPIRA